jgi:hypothetical protein
VKSKEHSRLADELIPDHSLEADEQDLFDHEDYVERLMQIIRHVDVGHTSANIALYGSWGSGKSGIAKRLKKRLEPESRFQYAEFEAFKFGRDPLLRNFVNQLAEQLFPNDRLRVKAYKRRLYESTSRPHVDLNQSFEKHRLIWWVAVIVFGLVSGFALGFWLWPGSEHRQEADNYFKLVGFLTFSVFLSYFTLSRSTSPATGDEEFEEIFEDMLERLKITETDRRLVVFVDELDRCSPSEVAATLESIRTFLGVKGCIFIVAADQQVLEHALTEQLRQSTPPDLANPYYSAGSAYLDKIFQYQLSFPPLRPRRLTDFALELVRHRRGVWADPEVDKEDVISTLLPTHIHSPRRVKVLLNAFALSFGIARSRAARNNLTNVATRAPELAKLVCIKLEFPLFARDLALDDRLTEAVLIAARSLGDKATTEKELEDFPREVRTRAKQYARGELRVAQLLSTDDSGREITDVPDETAADVQQARAESDDDAVASEATSQSVEDEDEGTVQERHALQLARYLEKTETVPGPGADLIHLESAGAVWGLDAQEAELLERDARDNRRRAVAQRIKNLEPEDRPKALLMLGRLVREYYGRDADNAMGALLAGAAAAEVSLEPIGHELVRDVEAYDDRRGLKGDNLPGALAIAIAANRQALAEAILERDEVVDNEALALNVLNNASALLPRHTERLAEVLAVAVRTSADRTKAALDQLDRRIARDLLMAAAPIASDYAQEVQDRFREETEGGALKLSESADAAAAASEELTRLYLPDNQELAELAFLPVFDMPISGTRVFWFLGEVERLKTIETTGKVLADIHQWGIDNTLKLMRALDERLIAEMDQTPAALDRLAKNLWVERPTEWDELPKDFAKEISRLLRTGIRPSGEEATEAMAEAIDGSIASDEALDVFERDERIAVELSELGLVLESFVADCSVRTATRSLSLPEPQPRPEKVASGLKASIEWLADRASTHALESGLEQVKEGTWLEGPTQYAVELVLLSALAQHEEVEVPTVAELKEALLEDRADADAAGIWIKEFAASPEEAYAAAEGSLDQPADKLLQGIKSYAESLGPKQLATLNLPAVEGAFARRPAMSFFEAARLERADESSICDALVALAKRAENREQRALLLDIWKALNPTQRKVREVLIRKVFLPIAQAGATSHDLARQRLELVANPPPAVREELMTRLVKSSPDSKRTKQLRAKMEHFGLTKGSKGFLQRLFGR